MKFGAALLPALVVVLLASCSLTLAAQNLPPRDSRELSFWVSGGRGTTGSTSDTGVLLGGMRYGWMLTRTHGPALLAGRFEYAVDAIPLFLVLQPQNAYGVALSPVVLKWMFDCYSRDSRSRDHLSNGSQSSDRNRSDHNYGDHSRGFAPYAEATAGLLFSNHDVPSGSSTVNFMPGVAVGIQFLGHRWNPNLAVRYMHISNAGLAEPNPGINTVQLTLGLTHIIR